jgi:hypothetical protein
MPPEELAGSPEQQSGEALPVAPAEAQPEASAMAVLALRTKSLV